ncbi:MAG: hypothetical protein EI684_14865 [Candidatus Viridilinea halotolerans]|uniref:Gluconeogenesis factor n=1 Tax=Candidatus Viridilinea halotolerans TaxID=2491704 RepID=A0A426TWA2_9CHLR|nr:MAG: hypothetical protein EI684_14865 [Candidatus Viridilinea halotolerans]
MLHSIRRRLASLRTLTTPLILTFVGVVLLSLGVAYLFIHVYRTVEGLPLFFEILTLQFLPRPVRGFLLLLFGGGTLAMGIWRLSDVVIVNLRTTANGADDELVLGYHRETPPSVAVISGGPGLLVLSALGEHVRRMTCIVPVQDQVEYYYRASGLFNLRNVYYVVPTPEPIQVLAELDDGQRLDVRHLDLDTRLAARHVTHLSLDGPQNPPLTRLAAETIRDADAIILGPGSLFESILPNLLIPELREAIIQSRARTIYVCNLMTEPGRTAGFSVAEHIRAIKTYGGFTPAYVLVNAQRIDLEVTRLYAAAHQSPVYLSPEEYEEMALLPSDPGAHRGVMIEGAMVLEADLASSVIQYTASLSNPSESRAARVLRHDSQKLGMAILELLRKA